MALDGETKQHGGSRVIGFAQPPSGYVEPYGGQREAGEVTVRCAFCDFEVGPVPLSESVRIGRAHRREHNGKDALVARIRESHAAGRSWVEIGAEVGMSPAHVSRLARGVR